MNKILFWTILSFSLHAVFADGPLPPIDSLFEPPRYSYPSLSPDGKYFVALYTLQKQTALMSYSIETNERGRTVLPARNDVYYYLWTGNNRIIYGTSINGMFIGTTGIIAADLKTPARILIENKSAYIINGLVCDADQALVWFSRDRGLPDQKDEVSVFNTTTGGYIKTAAHAPGMVQQWIVDLRGDPRICYICSKVPQISDGYYYHYAPGDKWRKLKFPGIDLIDIFGFAPDGKHLYISAYTGKNTFSLCLYDLDNEKISKELFNDPEFDFDGQLHLMGNPRSPEGVTLKGISYHGKSVWFDSSINRMQLILDSLLGSTRNVIIDEDSSLVNFLVASSSDIQPATYYLFNRRTSTLTCIAQSMPWINPEELCPVREFFFETSDSLRLSGFLTYPKFGKPPFPAVILCHGGPADRDAPVFDPEVQLLATHGYAVLQVNFRGSTGFGSKISRSFNYQYRLMHRDVVEATTKAIRSGIIDSTRIAIMGSSFGGFLALAGAAFTPDLYTCAISNAGVANWNSEWDFIGKGPTDRFYRDMLRYLSTEPDIEKYLSASSPENMVHQIKIPIFLAGGIEDQTVPIEQSVRLTRLLKRSGNKPETFFKLGERHGFRVQTNRLKYYRKVLDFLDRNMKRDRSALKSTRN